MNRTRRLFRKELPATLAACLLAASFTAGLLFFWPVSYTHLTLPTKLEV